MKKRTTFGDWISSRLRLRLGLSEESSWWRLSSDDGLEDRIDQLFGSGRFGAIQMSPIEESDQFGSLVSSVLISERKKQEERTEKEFRKEIRERKDSRD